MPLFIFLSPSFLLLLKFIPILHSYLHFVDSTIFKEIIHPIFLSISASYLAYLIINFKRNSILNNEIHSYLSQILNDMKYPFESITSWYEEYEYNSFSFNEADEMTSREVENDIDIDKPGPYIKNKIVQNNITLIYDYINAVNHNINIILRHEKEISPKLKEILIQIKESDYHKKYKSYVETEFGNIEFPPNYLQEQYKFSKTANRPKAIGGICIGNFTNPTLYEYILLYRKLTKFENKFIIMP